MSLYKYIGNIHEEKKAYKAYKKRVKALPDDYRLVLEEMEKYIWNFALGSGMLEVLYGLIDMFEDGARQGRDVLSLTGEDIGAFCDELIAQVRDETWTGKRRAKLNNTIKKELGKK